MIPFADYMPADSKSSLKGGFRDFVPEVKKEEKPKEEVKKPEVAKHDVGVKVILPNK